MSLHDQIFPSGPPRDGHIVRTEFVGSWESQFRGLGRLTAFLSDFLLRFSAAVDDIALNVIFLQRHRVEVGLKLLLERTHADVPATHDIDTLATRCVRALHVAGYAEMADGFWAEQREFIGLMHNADPKSVAYRYPVDTANQPSARQDFVDLQELEAAGGRYQSSVLLAVSILTESEPVPVTDDQVGPTAQEAAATIRAVKTTVAFTERVYSALREDGDRISRAVGRVSPQEPNARTVEARAAADAQAEVLETLEPPLLLLLRRLEPRKHLDTDDPVSLELNEIASPPTLKAASILSFPAHLDRRIEYVGKEAARHFGELKRALMAMHERSASWSSPPDRQLHADLGRLISRLLNGVTTQELNIYTDHSKVCD